MNKPTNATPEKITCPNCERDGVFVTPDVVKPRLHVLAHDAWGIEYVSAVTYGGSSATDCPCGWSGELADCNGCPTDIVRVA